MMTQLTERIPRAEKETIHSGHFMVSHFEAEAQDDYDDVAVPVPDEEQVASNLTVMRPIPSKTALQTLTGEVIQQQQFSIETSLTKLFKCMTLAYRQKLTSPKWNRFKGIKLRWKDKIRLNNVIWRCWHMQFIKKQSATVCQFASPLDVDTHVKPETTILEGKYWKRRAEAIKAEYKKWRMFFLSRTYEKGEIASTDMVSDMDAMECLNPNEDVSGCMLVDEDYITFMSDTLFSTITSNQPFAFPDTREIARGANLADFIQPSLGPLQPNLDDFMDTLEPLQELLGMSRLPPVPEETTSGPQETTYSMDTHIGQSRQEIVIAQQQHSPQPRTIKNKQSNQQQQSQLYSLVTPGQHQGYGEKLYTDAQPYGKPYGVITQGTSSQQEVLSLVQHSPPIPQPPQIYTSPERNSRIYNPTQYQTTYTPSRVEQPKLVTFEAKSTNVHRQNSLPQLQYTGQSRPPESVMPTKRSSPHDLVMAHNRSPENVMTSRTTPERLKLEQGIYDARMKLEPTQTNIVSPPVVNASQPTSVLQSKENYRSNSLPIGSQLNSDWTISQNSRRSTSSNVAPHPEHHPRPRPLLSTASEPAIPQASVLLAHLLTRQHSASVQRLNSPEDEPCSPSAIQGGSGRASPASPRRSTHLHAEQKRRYNIKNGFDTLQSLIPHLHNNPTAKVSKAAMLQKGAEYIRQLKMERSQVNEEMENLRQQIDTLNNSISNCHALLPATGAPVYRARSTRLREMFLAHVAARTQRDWKYWLFSVVASALLESFASCVSSNNAAELARTTLLWAEQHCSLVEMRPAVLTSLRSLCTATDILTHPERLPAEARAAAAAAVRANTTPSSHLPALKREPS